MPVLVQETEELLQVQTLEMDRVLFSASPVLRLYQCAELRPQERRWPRFLHAQTDLPASVVRQVRLQALPVLVTALRWQE